ncbi:MAG: DUF4388 domain-containing protein [Acidobacteria bacterium]|nr:DUF4388 domain-containing protein [Acidobacteriota bacterium]NIM62846.1 DUF4388 domain-containing protein [Acidobacteriota bacterium]NIO60476.1 DUF4388 domain-containing protein [Acidobacteriota bacterium]NIQ31582.1 DUF4388 domain-containing protein [Acidobacteriota bacterium]NIQ86832.1 DUF4388 domain-containing protein [Acidobacteriota bacterium]
MSIQGNLNTMKLADLLRWAVENNETGVLAIERNKVCKRIAFREGRITGCSSDDPPSRIGQFLLARGKITREELAKALDVQKETETNLGEILQDMGVIEAEEFAFELSAKAEENILSLFDWNDAVFRFKQNEPEDPWMLDVQLTVEEIIERGAERIEQVVAIRRMFVSSGVVLERGDVEFPPEIMNNGLARGILGTIDGERTIGEVLYHTHASDFLVLKFLVSAVHSGFVTIVGIREPNGESSTLLDTMATVGSAPEESAAEPVPDPVEKPSTDPATETSVPQPMAPRPPATFEERLELAQHLLAQDDVEAALEVLDGCYDERPGDEFLGHLIQKAETAFLTHCRAGDLKSTFVPNPIASLDVTATPLSPAELFLVGMMGEGHNIQTLLWVAPMREVDVYRALARLNKIAAIELRDAGDVDLKGEKAPAVEWA